MGNLLPKYKLNENLISMERLDGEVIIISFESGKYYSSSETGADLLWLLKQNVEPKVWEEVLHNRFNFDKFPFQEISDFLNRCNSEGIISNWDGDLSGQPDLPNDYEFTVWKKPELLAFADLQDLLMVDPIHDSSLEGWPQLKSNDD
jgi:hypothetical protein